jgi:S-methylmethionine-dependent homocysteine/selenocysteine methylase
MTTYRNNLPQLGTRKFITDGGLETVLMYQHQIALPEFAAYDLLRTDGGRQLLQQYYAEYIEIARSHECGIILETPTWRANADWGEKIGDSRSELETFNREAVALLVELRNRYQCATTPIVISGNMGPRGDGYTPGKAMGSAEAKAYHWAQLATFVDTEADMVCALTINYLEEAIGFASAAREQGIPICISFTVETDGLLPTGDTLESVIRAVDEATDEWPAYYMVNCAHSSHFRHIFEQPCDWIRRIRGVRTNASKLSHAELDNSTTLDDGNPQEYGAEMSDLQSLLPGLNVLGGCCGTDHRHIEAVCRSVACGTLATDSAA